MYTEITERFREDCRELNNMVAFILVPIVLLGAIIASAFPLSHKDYGEWLILTLMVIAIVLSALNYYLIVLLSIRKESQFSKRNFWRIISIIELYKEVMHKKDIQILIEILTDEGVNTRPKVLEVLRHYQCLLPRKVIGSSQIIAILALTISTITFIFGNVLSMSFLNQLITIAIIAGVIAIYCLGYVLNKRIFCYFGESALYLRIENAVSEIWMKSLIK